MSGIGCLKNILTFAVQKYFHMKQNSNITSARYLKRGDIVALYLRTYRVIGTFELFDGLCSCSRVLLASCTNKQHITMLDLSTKLFKSASNIYVPYD